MARTRGTGTKHRAKGAAQRVGKPRRAATARRASHRVRGALARPDAYDRPLSAAAPEIRSVALAERASSAGRALPELQIPTRRDAAPSGPAPAHAAPALLDAWFAEYGTAVSRAVIASSAQRSELTQRVIIGPDDRVRIRDTQTVPYRWICDLVIRAANGSSWLGTGWLAGPRTVITAGHCVYMRRQGGWVRRVDIYPGRDGAQIPFSLVSDRPRSVAGWVDGARPESDYGALVLPEPVADAAAWFDSMALSDGELAGLTVNLVGYPTDKEMGTMWGHARGLKEVHAETLGYDIDTYGGQSGAPVVRWVGNGRYGVVGIHNYGDLSGNSATRITRGVLKNIDRWKE
jgi:glutamyl endopeptidase